jgi:cell division transport system permease protein
MIGEALVGLRRNLLMTFAVILSVTVSLTLLGAVAAAVRAGQPGHRRLDRQGRGVDLPVQRAVLRGRHHPRAAGAAAERPREQPIVEQVFFESQDDAFERFQEMFKDDPDVAGVVEPDSLPASFRVKLVDPNRLRRHRPAVRGLPGRRGGRRPAGAAQRPAAVHRRRAAAALIVAAIQLVAAGVLIANTIRVAAFARREQTSIMKLVGASNWYVRLPFLFEGMIAGRSVPSSPGGC